eukprot:1158580-Pelagomonas_calceolata.AAC.14
MQTSHKQEQPNSQAQSSREPASNKQQVRKGERSKHVKHPAQGSRESARGGQHAFIGTRAVVKF